MEDMMRIVRNRALVVMLWWVAFLHLGQVSAAELASFPTELQSVWDPSVPCESAQTSDRDSRFEITRTQRLNYEEVEQITSAALLATSPKTWRIATTSSLGPDDLSQPRIYVLQDDVLAVSDGQSARVYHRCN
ncbi:MAG TPA: hypothetical protein VLK29_00475 [Luteimonas sp.]|nr:hypothetical protein [Luteimonas sp.]